MNQLFAILVLAAVLAVASAQYWGGYGYGGLGYSSGYYGGLGYSGYGYSSYPSYGGYGYGLGYYKK